MNFSVHSRLQSIWVTGDSSKFAIYGAFHLNNSNEIVERAWIEGESSSLLEYEFRTRDRNIFGSDSRIILFLLIFFISNGVLCHFSFWDRIRKVAFSHGMRFKKMRIHLILRHRFRNRFDYLNKWGEKCVFIWTLAEQRMTASNWNSFENLCIRAKRWSYVYPFRLCWLAAHCCLYPVQKSNFNATNVS